MLRKGAEYNKQHKTNKTVLNLNETVTGQNTVRVKEQCEEQYDNYNYYVNKHEHLSLKFRGKNYLDIVVKRNTLRVFQQLKFSLQSSLLRN